MECFYCCCFFIFAITSKIKKHRIFFLLLDLDCVWAMFQSGTRTAMACLILGIIAYVFLSKSVKIAIPVTILFGFAFFFLAFTNIGQGNQQIRRMRSALTEMTLLPMFVPLIKQTMRKYMKEAPWGLDWE